MEKVLLRSDRSIQWKAIIILAFTEIVISLFFKVELFRLAQDTILRETFISLIIYIVLDPIIEFILYALALFLIKDWSVSEWKKNLTLASAYATAITLFTALSRPNFSYDFRILLITWIIPFFIIFTTQYFTPRISNKLLIYFLSTILFGWVKIYLRNKFNLSIYGSNETGILPGLPFIFETLTCFFITMWLLSMFGIRFIFQNDPEKEKIRSIIEGDGTVYLTKAETFIRLKETTSLSDKKLAKILTREADPSYVDETKGITIFLSLLLLIDAMLKVYAVVITNHYQLPFANYILGFLYPFAPLLLFLFILVKLILPYGVIAFKPWAYWTTILLSVCNSIYILYTLKTILGYLNYYPGRVSTGQLSILLGSVIFYIIIAIIAFRILRKLFPNHRPVYLKRTDKGEYEI